MIYEVKFIKSELIFTYSFFRIEGVRQNRYLTTKNNNQMSLKPSSVEFKSNTNLQLGILLEDPMGAKFYSHKNIKFDAVEDIRFYTKKNINIIALVSIRIYVPSSKQSLAIMNEFDLVGNIVFLEGRDRSIFDPFNDEPILTKKPFSLGKLIAGVVAGLAVVAVLTITGGAVALAIAGANVALAVCSSIGFTGIGYVAYQASCDISSQTNSEPIVYARGAFLGCAVGAISYGMGNITIAGKYGWLARDILEETICELLHQTFRNIEYDEDGNRHINYNFYELVANASISFGIGKFTNKICPGNTQVIGQAVEESVENATTRVLRNFTKKYTKEIVTIGILSIYNSINTIKGISNGLKNTLEKGVECVKDTLEKGVECVKDTAEKGVEWTKDTAEKGVECVKDMAENMIETGTDIFDDVSENVENVIKDEKEKGKNTNEFYDDYLK